MARANFSCCVTIECVAGWPDKNKKRCPDMWFKAMAYNCNASTGHITKSEPGANMIEISWLFFMIL